MKSLTNCTKEILYPTVCEQLEWEGPINEMAVDIKVYKKRLESLQYQIIENWCLCMYCKLYDQQNFNFNHWRKEFRAAIDNIKRLNLRKGDKRKHTIQILIKDGDLIDPHSVYMSAREKFDIEGITDEKIQMNISDLFSKNIQGIIDLIVDDYIKVNEYTQKVFGL